MGSLFNVFAPSPIKPLEQHMRKVDQCARQLQPFFEAVLKQEWANANRIKDKIVHMEHEADKLKRHLRLNLPSGVFLPVSRTDLLEVLRAQDAIANKAQHIAELIVGRQMTLPTILSKSILLFLHRALDASKQACTAINELDELLESSFRGSEVKIVEKMITTLDDIESDCDEKLSDIRNKIFKLEKEIPPIEVFFLYKLVQWIGDLADFAQTVGSRLQILIAR